MIKRAILYILPSISFLIFSLAHADDTLFSTNLFAKFHAGSCTICHDYWEKDKNGLAFTNHKKRNDVNRCTKCHKSSVTGFKHSSEWFAQPGLYTSGMDERKREVTAWIKKAV